ncbi:class I SAM-dependent methyltransferase [Phreatobacter sp. AB_2022a]|uniref:class I SAM-dependent methyltransferase n=1 Tax=Phreatobacter sp. AB_2022a TaxID=3003134 RepID=UPI00228744D4|nr:class I SAM-dependent methyltransferase [Phreatobacter sp. AB_2022a]MCZ0733717.1 class I SAM-dependent methyltransferase [Phreatobacter sp. AB_2022a]
MFATNETRAQVLAGSASAEFPEAVCAVETLQKVADAADFFDPRLDHVIRQKLQATPSLHARLWEFGMAYLALAAAGKLSGAQRGISFGSGSEPLIFPIAMEAGHLVATDLYNGASMWEVARTDDCRAFVLSCAPPAFDASRLEVCSLDMRHIAEPAASFDFAYSISAFEHIGAEPDFLQHLRGVRRILKPDGVYVLTTELRFGGASHAVVGNYAFALPHLLSLFEEAGLNPEPTIDYRLTEHAGNYPRDLRETKFRDRSNHGLEQVIVREGGGIMSAPMLFVLRPQAYRAPQIVGYEQSAAWLKQQLSRRTEARLSDWFTLNPFGATLTSQSPYVDLWTSTPPDKGLIVFATSYHYFGDNEVDVRVNLTTSADVPSDGEMIVGVMSWSTDDIADMVTLDARRVTVAGVFPGVRHLRLHFEATANRCYSVFGTRVAGDIVLGDVTVYARRTPARAG